MKPMQVNPDSMESDGQQMTQVAQDMASGFQGLSTTIQGDGNPWGSDEQGSIFAGLYQMILGHAFESIVSHVNQVGYAGQALTAQAGGYRTVEDANTQNISTVDGAS